jgi:uncharacterized small protein (DUF1192 family)
MFGNSSNVAIEKLQKNSSKILSVFTKTITDLTKVNSEVDEHIAFRQAEIQRIEAENATLGNIKAENEKVISKINKIFE